MPENSNKPDRNGDQPELEIPPEKLIYPVVVFESFLGLGGVFAAWLFDYLVLTYFRPDLESLRIGLLAVIPPVALFFILIKIPLPVVRELESKIRDHFMPVFSGSSVVDLFLLSLLAGVSEEILFRGFLQTLLVDHTGIGIAIIVSAIAFGFAHAMTVLYAAIATLMGAYLSYLFYLTGDLTVPVLVHTIYNFVAFLYYLKTGTGEKDRPVSGE